MHKYRDVPITSADACLVHLAAELKIGEILTLDDDFRIYRWEGNKRFQLRLPLSGRRPESGD